MRIEELIDIIKLADKKDIAKEFKRLGYFYCNSHSLMSKIGIIPFVQATIQGTEDFADEKGKHIYSGHICGPIAGYENYEFVYVNIYSSKPSADPLARDESVLHNTEIDIWAIEKDED